MSDFSTNYNSVRTDKGLSAEVINGAIKQTEKIEKIKTAEEMNSLGKDAFLRLLVAQMEHQDPLQPQSNTEWVSQLATYSTLEEMKNMGNTMSNSQAFGMIGSTVIVGSKDAHGDSVTISGVVDFVSIKNNKAYVSIEGNMYPAEDVQSILNPRYLNGSVLPKVERKVLKLSKDKPEDLFFKVSLGGEVGKASGFSVTIGDKRIAPQHFKMDEHGNVRLNAAALKDFEKGVYPITIHFNNDFKTMDRSSLKLVIVNKSSELPSEPQKKPEKKVDEGKKPENSDKTEPPKKPENSDKTEPPKKPENSDKTEPPKKPENSDKTEPPKKPENSDKTEPPKKPENSDKAEPPKKNN